MKKNIVIICVAVFCFLWTGIFTTVYGQGAHDIDIEEYVRQVYINGISYEEASRYSAEEALEVLGLLNSSEEERFWANIVIVASMAGDERVVGPILDFIERSQSGEINRDQYNAKTSAIMSLGYVIHHTENDEALDYLLQSLDPEIWDERRIRWNSPIHDEYENLYIQLSTMAVLGLGLSGNSEAADALRSLEERSDSPLGQTFREQLGGTLDEALEANQKIAEIGLAGYYRESEENWKQRRR